MNITAIKKLVKEAGLDLNVVLLRGVYIVTDNDRKGMFHIYLTEDKKTISKINVSINVTEEVLKKLLGKLNTSLVSDDLIVQLFEGNEVETVNGFEGVYRKWFEKETTHTLNADANATEIVKETEAEFNERVENDAHLKAFKEEVERVSKGLDIKAICKEAAKKTHTLNANAELVEEKESNQEKESNNEDLDTTTLESKEIDRANRVVKIVTGKDVDSSSMTFGDFLNLMDEEEEVEQVPHTWEAQIKRCKLGLHEYKKTINKAKKEKLNAIIKEELDKLNREDFDARPNGTHNYCASSRVRREIIRSGNKEMIEAAERDDERRVERKMYDVARKNAEKNLNAHDTIEF